MLSSLVTMFDPESNLKALKIFRMVRLIRPFRLISKNQNLKLSLQALIISIPNISVLLVMVWLIMFVFGIIGVNLMKGTSFYCDISVVIGLTQREIETLILTKEDCFNYGGGWRLKESNFDDIWSSMINMVVMAQVVSWPTLMYQAVNSRGPDLVPGYKEGGKEYVLYPFFVLFVLIGAFFIMNLFVGEVI